MAGVGDTVMVVMESPDWKKIAWDGREFKLEKGKEAFLPFELAANYFGDPRSSGAMQTTQDHRRRYGWIPDRPTEVRRLRVLYGVQHGDESCVYLQPEMLENLVEDDPQSAHKKRHWPRIDANIPRVKIYDLETHEELPTVLADPLGLSVNSAKITMSDDQRKDDRIRRLEEMVETLMADRRPSGLVTPGFAVPPSPGSEHEKSAAEKALGGAEPTEEEFGSEPGKGSPEDLEFIETHRSGSAGLPADRG